MLRKFISQLAFVNGERICNMTLASDAATSSTQGEMDLSSLLCVCIANLPTLFSGKDQIQPRVFHYKQRLRGTPQGTPLISQFLVLSSIGVAAVSKDSSAAAVSAVSKDSSAAAVSAVSKDSFGAAVAATYLPFQICRRRILLEASSAEFCPRGSGIVLAARRATFLSSLGICFGSFRHVASPGKLRRGCYLSPNGYGVSF